MKSTILVSCFLLFYILTARAQIMEHRPLEQLINKEEPGWPEVKKWMAKATNKIEVLPKVSDRADSALYHAQVTTRSPMGAIIYETGGIFVDNGWIRILGSGCPRMDRSLMQWNVGKAFNIMGERPSFLLIADDVLGGFFAINAGGLDKKGMGKVFYFAPDNLTWNNTDLSYSEFLNFCFTGNIEKFYKGYRWKNWKQDVDTLDGNTGISVFPFLFSKEGKDINKDSRMPVPIQELWDLYFAKSEED